MIQILLKQAAFEAQSVALAFLTSTGARPITPDVTSSFCAGWNAKVSLTHVTWLMRCSQVPNWIEVSSG